MALDKKSGGKYRLSGSERSYANRTGLRKKKRRTTWNFPLIGLVLLVFIVMISMVVWGARKIIDTFKQDNSIVVENKMNREVMVEGRSIFGLTAEEVKTFLKTKYVWSMHAKLEGASEDSFDIPNMTDGTIDQFVDGLYALAEEPLAEYTLTFSADETEIKKSVEQMAQKWNKKAKNGSISGFDKETKSFIYSGEESGLEIDQDKILSDVKAAIEAKNFTSEIRVDSKEIEADITEAEVKQMYRVIGTFTTKTTDNQARNTNIRLAAESMDGMIIQPGEEFSFNKTTGHRTEDKGYKPAGAYLDGVLIEEPGGGVCQVSSTLYNAVVKSGLTTVERHAHTYEPTYCNPGEDAMVSYDGYDGPDMRFKNTSEVAVAIRATYENKTIKMSIVGIPVLEDGVEVKMVSEKTNELDSPEPQYVDDPSVPEGTEILMDKPTKGSRWVTNLITYKNGEEISRVFLHNSQYDGHPAHIKKNPNSKPKGTTSDLTKETVGETKESTSASARESATIETTESEQQQQRSTERSSSRASSSSARETTEETSQSVAETTKGPGNHITSAAPTTAETTGAGPSIAPTSPPESDLVETIPPNPGTASPIGPGANIQ